LSKGGQKVELLSWSSLESCLFKKNIFCHLECTGFNKIQRRMREAQMERQQNLVNERLSKAREESAMTGG